MRPTIASSRLAALAFALPLLAASCGGEEDAGVLRFAAVAPTAGTACDVNTTQDMSMVVVATRDDEEIQRREHSYRVRAACRVTVDAADATSATAGTIAYGECLTTKRSLEEPLQPQPEAWSGKSYAVERDATGRMVVRGGAELLKEERSVVELTARHHLDPAPLAPYLAGKRLKKGDSVEVPLEVARLHLDVFGAGNGVQALTLVVADQLDAPHDAVVFRAAARVKTSSFAGIPDETMEVAYEPVGLWTVSRSTCRVISLSMQGPVTLRGLVGMYFVTGDGESAIAWSVATK